MSRYLSRRIEQTKNIELLTNSEITRMTGKGHLEAIEIRDNRTGATRMVETPAVFTFIGAVPHTEWLPEGIETDQEGFVKTGSALTNSPFWTAQRRPHFLETSRPWASHAVVSYNVLDRLRHFPACTAALGYAFPFGIIPFRSSSFR